MFWVLQTEISLAFYGIVGPRVYSFNKQSILSCCFSQYFSPYLSADMSKMAIAFNTTVLKLEDELMQLILDGQINARIDSHSKVGFISSGLILSAVGPDERLSVRCKHFRLKKIDMLGRFSTISTEGGSFYGFHCVFLYIELFQKRGLFVKEMICSTGPFMSRRNFVETVLTK